MRKVVMFFAISTIQVCLSVPLPALAADDYSDKPEDPRSIKERAIDELQRRFSSSDAFSRCVARCESRLESCSEHERTSGACGDTFANCTDSCSALLD